MKSRPIWDLDGRDWPNRVHSRFVEAAGLTWHVQVMGQGPLMLLIHGTGAATHSWRDIAPILAKNFTLIMPDLPGHGFTSRDPAQSLTLPNMAASLSRLLATLGLGAPQFVVGHSAGAAIAVRMSLDSMIAPQKLVSLNGAFKSFNGLAAYLYPALAKLLFLNPVAPSLIAWRAADPLAVARVIKGTGSVIDARGLDCYVRLLRTTRHVAAALGMMAKWDLRPLDHDLSRLTIPLILVACAGDLAVPLSVGESTHRQTASSQIVIVPRLGHLAHEEQPAQIAALIHETCL
jgi:magnesium chelatase accessory protein